MCVFISAEAVLAVAMNNMGKAGDGLSYRDLSNFGDNIRKNLFIREKDKSGFLFMDLMSRSFDDCVRKNPESFSKFLDRYYPGINIDENHFTVGIDQSVIEVMRDTARQTFTA